MNYSLEAEQAVLGKILYNPELIHDTILNESDFYHKPHQIVFEKMLVLREEDTHIDPVTLSSALGVLLSEIGGITYLMSLNRSTVTTGDIKWYEAIVKNHSIIRTGNEKIFEVCNEGITNPTTLAHKLMNIAETMEIKDEKRGLHQIGNTLMDHYDKLIEKNENQKKIGFCTAGKDLDKITGRWLKQSLNVIGARPSVGKTAFMLNNARRCAEEGNTVAIFSLEQPEEQLYDRMLSAECHIDGDRMKSGQLLSEEWQKYTMGLSKLADLDIYIDDRQGLTVRQIRSEVRKLKKTNPNLIVFIDYLQLVKAGQKTNSRAEEVGYVSGALKQMARENDCPVVALAQLNRGVEQRQDKRPMISDLRESGNIEQDADTISFLYRDDYYDRESDKKNIIEIIVAKNREGSTGTAEMVMIKNYCKFADLDRGHY